MVDIKIGADPEFFLTDKETKKPVSAHGLVPGTKKKPHKLDAGAVQLDGTAVEFNIEPAATAFEFTHNITVVLKQIREMIPEKYDFNFSPVVTYSKAYFDTIPESSKELGCDPDFDALSLNPLQAKPKPNQKSLMRTGAGHIHIGWLDKVDPTNADHLWDCVEFSKQAYHVFNTAAGLYDKDTQRALMYGGGATFRPKTYGLEYRSPSNAWLNYPKLWSWIFETSKDMVYRLQNDDVGLRDFQYHIPAWNYKYQTDVEKLRMLNGYCKKIKMPCIPENWREVA